MKTATIVELLKWTYTALGSLVLSFVVPIAPFLVFMFALVMCDMYTGVRAAVHRKEVVRSHGFRRTIEKLSLYFVGLLLAHGTEVTFGINWNFPYIVAGIVVVTELKSNFENISEVTGVDFWANIVKRLPSIGDLMKKGEPEKEAQEEVESTKPPTEYPQ